MGGVRIEWDGLDLRIVLGIILGVGLFIVVWIL